MGKRKLEHVVSNLPAQVLNMALIMNGRDFGSKQEFEILTCHWLEARRGRRYVETEDNLQHNLKLDFLDSLRKNHRWLVLEAIEWSL